MSGKRILPWMHLQGCWKRSGAEVLPTCPGVWRRGKNKLAKREFVSLLISDKEKKTVSVLGHFSLLHTESKYQLPVYQMIKKNQEWNYIGSSSLFGRAGLTLKFLEIFKKNPQDFQNFLCTFQKLSQHSPPPIASWILHSLPVLAATNSRDEQLVFPEISMMLWIWPTQPIKLQLSLSITNFSIHF